MTIITGKLVTKYKKPFACVCVVMYFDFYARAYLIRKESTSYFSYYFYIFILYIIRFLFSIILILEYEQNEQNRTR